MHCGATEPSESSRVLKLRAVREGVSAEQPVIGNTGEVAHPVGVYVNLAARLQCVHGVRGKGVSIVGHPDTNMLALRKRADGVLGVGYLENPARVRGDAHVAGPAVSPWQR